tara:strand:- start:1435 stop:2004 length:570 start_codon:yes stop_codon:yes gene_type:complete
VKKRGFLGGTFDPPHNGHLFLAKSAINNLALDELVFCVANRSPFKIHRPPIASAKDRLEMVCIMIKDHKKMRASDFEVKKGGLSYTIDLIYELKRLNPDDELFMIVSNDVFNTLNSFKDIQKILKLCKIAVGARSCVKLKTSFEHVFFEDNFLEISSTKLREALNKKADIASFLDTKVFDFISQKNIYF